MGQTPSTVIQIALLIVFVLPGIVYQFLRERWRGPVPGEREVGERVLRAVTASVVLDVVYAIALGPQLIRLYGTNGDGLAKNARLAGAAALVLLFVIPAAAAALTSWLRRRRLRSRYRTTPTAWDHAFRDRKPSFVRVRLSDGTWVGGWYGTQSFASSYPNPRELYLQSAWRMRTDGGFVERVDHTDGLYLRADSVEVLEILESPDQER
ncbi:DUF6338 family protein [Amycolatopsis keratiniphila]|uniref:DUF6338 family protein n=1 Tax=Amycolatopsis keratiniphila TaxID=129921 RepID=UPI00340CE1F8